MNMKNLFNDNTLSIYFNRENYFNGFFRKTFNSNYNSCDWILVINNIEDLILIIKEIEFLITKEFNHNSFSFIIVIPFPINKLKILESIIIAPTLTEALDIIKIDRIQRDLE
tara:strand:+ start:667 stop:1002 length:336 start_codon:yes stop_codon:yes gene_type:complete